MVDVGGVESGTSITMYLVGYFFNWLVGGLFFFIDRTHDLPFFSGCG